MEWKKEWNNGSGGNWMEEMEWNEMNGRNIMDLEWNGMESALVCDRAERGVLAVPYRRGHHRRGSVKRPARHRVCAKTRNGGSQRHQDPREGAEWSGRTHPSVGNTWSTSSTPVKERVAQPLINHPRIPTLMVCGDRIAELKAQHHLRLKNGDRLLTPDDGGKRIEVEIRPPTLRQGS